MCIIFYKCIDNSLFLKASLKNSVKDLLGSYIYTLQELNLYLEALRNMELYALVFEHIYM